MRSNRATPRLPSAISSVRELRKVDVRIGRAAESLRQMNKTTEERFDVVFIDADKSGYVDYLRPSLPLLRHGELMLADNTLPDAVLTYEDSGTKRYNAEVAQSPELASIAVPILRSRGLNGLTVSCKR